MATSCQVSYSGGDKLGPGNAHKKTDLGYCPYISQKGNGGFAFLHKKKYISDEVSMERLKIYLDNCCYNRPSLTP